MESNIKWHFEARGKRIVDAVRKNNIQAEYVPGAQELTAKVMSLIPDGSTVGMGGSVTLVQSGLLEALRQRTDLKLLDRFLPGLPPERMKQLFLAALTCDVFISGVNAITEKGELFFLDAQGNRVAPILYGPAKVIIISGANKIVTDLPAAQERMRKFTSPTNAKRLNKKTPCVETGYCMNCQVPERICNNTVLIHKQAIPDRMHLIVAGTALGY